ncbi:uncharacterized protein LOC117933915 [Vitis riparia]|uniref:uncharacterized protein LOC117933915 n=1 Tax=Vitis riparia TaxID=96939 RepID=UPI00155A7CBE|nr:uncharacterized protein LOC117933915 [Vitis riparia]
MGHRRGSYLSNAMRACLEPKTNRPSCNVLEGDDKDLQTFDGTNSGASRVSEAGVGLVLLSSIGKPLDQSIHLDFPTSNKEAEYEAIIVGLELALALAASKVEIGSDSQLVVEQIQQEYEARDERMTCHLNGLESCLAKLSDWKVKRIPHEENRKADALVRVVVSLPITKYIMLPVYV